MPKPKRADCGHKTDNPFHMWDSKQQKVVKVCERPECQRPYVTPKKEVPA